MKARFIQEKRDRAQTVFLLCICAALSLFLQAVKFTILPDKYFSDATAVQGMMQGTVQFGFSDSYANTALLFQAMGRFLPMDSQLWGGIVVWAGSEISAAHMGALYAFRPIQRAASGICVECPQRGGTVFLFSACAHGGHVPKRKKCSRRCAGHGFTYTMELFVSQLLHCYCSGNSFFSDFVMAAMEAMEPCISKKAAYQHYLCHPVSRFSGSDY